MLERLNYQFQTIRAIRDYFNAKGFVDVITPPVVECPVIEPHIQSFQLYSSYKKELQNLHLHTSPEFYMKFLLSLGMDKIFQISYCFRDEPNSPIHRKQFLMLEWYERDIELHHLIERVIDLTKSCLKTFGKNENISFTTLSIQDLFKKELSIDILNFLDKDSIKELIGSKFPEVPLPKVELPWEDYYHLLFLNLIEPKLNQYPFLILKDYPAPLSALSKINNKDPRICERFEFFINGVEIANAYNELTDIEEQKKRFENFNATRSKLYGYKQNTPTLLFKALENKLPQSCGIALGVERFMGALLKIDNTFFPAESEI